MPTESQGGDRQNPRSQSKARSRRGSSTAAKSRGPSKGRQRGKKATGSSHGGQARKPGRTPYEPSQETIRDACLRFQAEWTAEEELSRRGRNATLEKFRTNVAVHAARVHTSRTGKIHVEPVELLGDII